MTAKEIRQSFKDFFESKGHLIVPSAPMVVKGDPTLMFTNAGMNQFKDIILGNAAAKSKRVADSQKCLRVSGKHNDLEEVGHDTYHHTMFEMLGNWSFGDYFKKEAIDWAWEYLVDVLKLDPKNLYATVFEGSEEEGIARDDEAASYWEKHLPKDHIINGNKHDNFWEMGDTGPCGPCSEIHVDSRSEQEKAQIPGRELVNKDHPQVIEIWNLVFMQYNRKADHSLEPLPAKVIDTGMGFERLVRTLQGKQSNYDTDVFQPMIETIGNLSGKKYGVDKDVDVAMRVIADHIRTISFAITDGQLPSNAKAGYVIRRILRRAVRYAYTFLGQKDAFLYKLLPTLIESMGDAYPELEAQKVLVEKVIIEEEEAFLRTLETGMRLLDKVIADAKASGTAVVNGVSAFTLYDTFGFPLDLTQLILRENGLSVDTEQFDVEMGKQKQRARNAAATENGDWITIKEGESSFVGYDVTEHDCSVLRYRSVKQKDKTQYQLVLDYTPFYAEMGGQLGDSGVLVSEYETVDIVDTKKENGLAIHICNKLPEHIDAPMMACVNVAERRASESNHTATHLLDEALREVLGTHIEQKGSMVSPKMLRFDFSHFQKVTDQELRQVEAMVNEKIRENIPLTEYRDYPIEKARQLGAIALFGEKYGDKVRVVQFGNSIEFCGGVHAHSTGQIGMFRILSESSISAGVRRIEAITGKAVEDAYNNMSDTLAAIKGMFNNVPDIQGAISKFLAENSELKKQCDELLAEKSKIVKDSLVANSSAKGNVKIIKGVVNMPADAIRNLAFQLRAENAENTAIVLGSVTAGRPGLTIALTDDLVKAGKNAGMLIRSAAKHIQGGGGGQPHFASAGGKDASGLEKALEQVILDL